MLTCDKCAGQITEDSHLCPHCGDPVTEADHPSAESIGKTVAVVELSFGHSSSQNYDGALQICRNTPSYTESGEGKQLRHTVALPITEIELILNLHRLVGGWKSSRMLINGQLAQRSDLVYRAAGCYRNRQKTPDRDLYCFGKEAHEANIWGCKRLGLPALAWGGGWLDYGKFDSKRGLALRQGPDRPRAQDGNPGEPGLSRSGPTEGSGHPGSDTRLSGPELRYPLGIHHLLRRNRGWRLRRHGG